ncbi:MAG: tetratricopeptide repeat protein [Bacteroidales bacterium]
MRKAVLNTLLVGLLVVVAASCGSIKTMQKNHNQVRYQVSPNPLEAHGDKVIVTINGNIPENYFQKNAVVYMQPILTWETGEVILSPMNLKGSKIEGNGKAIDKKTGGRFVYKDTVLYREGMENAQLTLNPVAYKAKAVNEADATHSEALENPGAIQLGNVKISQGINSTSNRVDIRGDLSMAPHNYSPKTTELMSANIYFTVNLADLNWNNEQNKKNDAKRAVDNMKSYIANNSVPRQIFVNAWASPEGEESFNIGLSKKRSETTEKLVNSILDEALTERAKAENIKPADVKKYIQDAKKDVVIQTNAKGEDWDNFIRLVEGSSLREKNTVINVVKSQPDKIRREQEIRNMSVVFRQIEEDILPILRRGEIAFNFSGVQKTDQEIAKMAVTNPDDLTFDELMYAASLTSNYANKLAIYKSATERFGSQWEGWNNAGAVGLTLNQLDESRQYLETADKLSPNNATIKNNLALLHLALKDVQTADKYMQEAVALGNEQAMVNQAIVDIKKGNYEEAARKLDGRKCVYNLALLQLLTGNTGNAIRTLDCCMDQTAEVNYLRAVCYARLDDVPGLIKNLREATKQEPAYKYKAKNDIEFRRYISNYEFQTIVNN